jgi:hypothetical protein
VGQLYFLIFSNRNCGRLNSSVQMDTCSELSSDDGGSTHLWNVGRQSFYTAVQLRRQLWTSYSPPWELEISQMDTFNTSVWWHHFVWMLAGQEIAMSHRHFVLRAWHFTHASEWPLTCVQAGYLGSCLLVSNPDCSSLVWQLTSFIVGECKCGLSISGPLTFWSRNSSKYHLRIESLPQRSTG